MEIPQHCHPWGKNVRKEREERTWRKNMRKEEASRIWSVNSQVPVLILQVARLQLGGATPETCQGWWWKSPAMLCGEMEAVDGISIHIKSMIWVATSSRTMDSHTSILAWCQESRMFASHISFVIALPVVRWDRSKWVRLQNCTWWSVWGQEFTFGNHMFTPDKSICWTSSYKVV
jgi:hypothetical protein